MVCGFGPALQFLPRCGCRPAWRCRPVLLRPLFLMLRVFCLLGQPWVWRGKKVGIFPRDFPGRSGVAALPCDLLLSAQPQAEKGGLWAASDPSCD
ncbi:unnamed protein product [Gulo gulo]|uniref:Uncharacterized protein n=1 Tax=Gulo gulo TaxID=48420 RepID=A0A9X9Q5H4_GULGU|nr:unnamed protein product [Gulo gulo]